MNKPTLSALHFLALAGSLFVASEGRAVACGSGEHHAKVPTVDDFKLTILSDFIPGRNTTGEWGFSALVEVTTAGTTTRVLFDTGSKPNTVLDNAKVLGINLCNIEDVVISHNNADHIGGLTTLRTNCMKTNPNAMSRAHVGAEEIFWPRIDPQGNQKNPILAVKSAYEALGGTFVINDQPHQFVTPGLFLTGRITRTHDEKTYVPVTPMQIQDPSGTLGVDLVPEDQALVINTPAGVVVLTGCAHSGAINTIEQAVRIVGGGRPSVMLAGGLHLHEMEQGDRHTVGTLDWEAQRMAELNVVAMLGGHCTGFERFVYVREYLGLDQSRAAFASVGTAMGLNPLFTYTLPQASNAPIPMNPQHSHHHGWGSEDGRF